MIKFKVRILTKNFITDYISNIKNIVGGRLKTYEKMIEDNLNELIIEMYTEYPTIKDIKIDLDEFTNGALIAIIYGEVDDTTTK